MSGEATRAYRLVDTPAGPGPAIGQRFKQYPQCPRIPLPWPVEAQPEPPIDLLGLLAAATRGYAPTRASYATAESHAAITGGTPTRANFATLRPVPSGGAYHPAELYAAVSGDGSLEAGLYHYDAVHHVLERIACGDPSAVLRAALGTDPGACTLLVTCRLWKNATKYADFGYRLGAVDTGIVVGQVLTTAPSASRVRLWFDDAALSALLGLDSALEAVYCAIDLAAELPGRPATDGVGRAATQHLGMMLDRELAASASPAAVRLHAAATGVHSGESVLRNGHRPAATTDTGLVALPPPHTVDLAAGVACRRSAARFGPGPLDPASLGTVLRALAEPSANGMAVDVHVAVSRVYGIASGAYRYVPAGHGLAPGPTIGVDKSARTDVGTTLQDAAAVYLFTDIDSGVADLGDRWYRIAHMSGGMAIQRACLAAAAVGFGCRVSFAYRADEVRRMLGVPDRDADLIQLLLGRAADHPGTVSFDFTGPACP